MNNFHIYIIPLTFNQLYFVNKFRRRNIKVIGLDDNENNLHRDKVDFFLPCDPKQINKLEFDLIKKSTSIGFFGLNSDFGIKKAIELSKITGIRNNFSVGEKTMIFDKYHYLRMVNQNFINLPSKTKLLNNKFHYIKKPRFGSGSRNISILNQKNFKENIDDSFILQRRFIGIEYSVDGVNFNGTPIVFTVSKRNSEKFSAQTIISIRNSNKIFNKIKGYVKKNKPLFPDNTTFPFHIELINDLRFGLQIIDFSPRGGGFSLGDFFINLTTGINLSDLYLNYLITNKFKIPKIKYMYSMIYFIKYKKGVFKEITFNNNLLSKKDKFIQLIDKNELMVEPCNDNHRIGFFILSSIYQKDLKKKFMNLKKSISIKTA